MPESLILSLKANIQGQWCTLFDRKEKPLLWDKSTQLPWLIKFMAKILLVIDLQEEFKDSNGMYEKIIDYCREHRNEYDIVLPTLFCNNYESNPNYIDRLHWDGCDHTTSESLAIFPKNNLDLDKACYEYKHGYASKQILKIADKNKDVIDVVGCDSDACVMATAFRLWDEGYNFRILTDHIYTTAKDFTNEDVIKLMRRNFGDCVL